MKDTMGYFTFQRKEMNFNAKNIRVGTLSLDHEKFVSKWILPEFGHFFLWRKMYRISSPEI